MNRAFRKLKNTAKRAVAMLLVGLFLCAFAVEDPYAKAIEVDANGREVTLYYWEPILFYDQLPQSGYHYFNLMWKDGDQVRDLSGTVAAREKVDNDDYKNAKEGGLANESDILVFSNNFLSNSRYAYFWPDDYTYDELIKSKTTEEIKKLGYYAPTHKTPQDGMYGTMRFNSSSREGHKWPAYQITIDGHELGVVNDKFYVKRSAYDIWSFVLGSNCNGVKRLSESVKDATGKVTGYKTVYQTIGLNSAQTDSEYYKKTSNAKVQIVRMEDSGYDEGIKITDNVMYVKNSDDFFYQDYYLFIARPIKFTAIVSDYTVRTGTVFNVDDQVMLTEGTVLTVEPGAVLSIEGNFYNNGVINNKGTIVVQKNSGITTFGCTGTELRYLSDYGATWVGGTILCNGYPSHINEGNLLVLPGGVVDFGSESGPKTGTLHCYGNSLIQNMGIMVFSVGAELGGVKNCETGEIYFGHHIMGGLGALAGSRPALFMSAHCNYTVTGTFDNYGYVRAHGYGTRKHDMNNYGTYIDTGENAGEWVTYPDVDVYIWTTSKDFTHNYVERDFTPRSTAMFHNYGTYLSVRPFGQEHYKIDMTSHWLSWDVVGGGNNYFAMRYMDNQGTIISGAGYDKKERDEKVLAYDPLWGNTKALIPSEIKKK